MPFDDVEVNPDGSYAFDAIDFYEDGRSLLQWFEPRRAPKALPRPIAAPKKKTPAKLEAATPPRKPREVEPKTTPLKFSELKMGLLETKPMKLFGEPKDAVRPLSLRIIVGGVEVIAGGRA